MTAEPHKCTVGLQKRSQLEQECYHQTKTAGTGPFCLNGPLLPSAQAQALHPVSEMKITALQ